MEQYKEFEILSLVSNSDPNCILKDRSNIKSWSEGWSQKYWDIHSIKRLSDEEIFIIGDTIKVIKGKKVLIISGFEIMISGTLVVYTNEDNGFKGGSLGKGVHISNILSYKKPLHIANDGTKLFENDEFYHVDPDLNIGTGRISIGCKHFHKLEGYKEFGTRGAAEQYVKLMTRKELLFITHDDVRIHHPSEYWVLNTNFKNWIFKQETTRDNVKYFYGSDNNYSAKTGIYYFSSKKAAEKYVHFHSSKLSINDVKEVLGTRLKKREIEALIDIINSKND